MGMLTEQQKRECEWLRNNSILMIHSYGELEAMKEPAFMWPYYTDQQIWARYQADHVSGLFEHYFIHQKTLVKRGIECK